MTEDKQYAPELSATDVEAASPGYGPDKEAESDPMEMPTGEIAVSIQVHPTEGGSVMNMSCFDDGGVTRMTAVVSGRPTAASYRRKVQRLALRWIREAINAPATAGKGLKRK